MIRICQTSEKHITDDITYVKQVLPSSLPVTRQDTDGVA
jgi:hypothetical protein